MKASHGLAIPVFFLALMTLSCGDNNNAQPPQDKEAKIKAGLAKLDDDDRKAAEEQKFCAVETDNRLGSMGKPIKVTLGEEEVFVCCKHCEEAARKNPSKTLAHAEEFKIQSALDELDPADRKLAEEQKFCATDPESRLGSMGKPAKVMIKDQPVFLCCKGCEKAARKDPDKTLAAVKKLKSANAEAKTK